MKLAKVLPAIAVAALGCHPASTTTRQLDQSSKAAFADCHKIEKSEQDIEVRCPGLYASYSSSPPRALGGPSAEEQRIGEAVSSNMGPGPAKGRVTLQIAGQTFEAIRYERPAPKGLFVEHRITTQRDGRTYHLGCGTLDDGETPPHRCRALLEHMLASGGPVLIAPEPSEGTRDAPAPLGKKLRLPGGCQVLNLLGGDGNIQCDDKSTLVWMKLDPDLAGDPIVASSKVLRDAVPPALTWSQTEPSCKLVGTDARCRQLELVGGAVALRARMATATVNGATRFVQCMIMRDGDKASSLCDQLIQVRQ